MWRERLRWLGRVARKTEQNIVQCTESVEDNNNTGYLLYLLHAISPKSKEHTACYKHYGYKLQKRCYKTSL